MKRKSIIQYKLRQIGVLMGLMGIFGLFICARILIVPVSEQAGGQNTYLMLSAISDGCITFTKGVLVLSVLIAMLGFKEYASREQYEFIRGLPYTRRQIWFTWFLMGFLWISLIFFMVFTTTAIFYQMHWPEINEIYMGRDFYEKCYQMDSLGNAGIIILNYWLICVCIYSLAVFARMIMHNLLGAILTFGGILELPYVLLANLRTVLTDERFSDFLEEWRKKLDLYLTMHPIRMISYEKLGVTMDYYFPYVQNLIAWGIFTLLFIVLAYRMAQNEHSSNKLGKTAVYETLFMLGTGIYIVFIVSHLTMFRDKEGKEALIIMGITFLIVETVLFYVVKSRGKYDYLNGREGGFD